MRAYDYPGVQALVEADGSFLDSYGMKYKNVTQVPLITLSGPIS